MKASRARLRASWEGSRNASAKLFPGRHLPVGTGRMMDETTLHHDCSLFMSIPMAKHTYRIGKIREKALADSVDSWEAQHVKIRKASATGGDVLAGTSMPMTRR